MSPNGQASEDVQDPDARSSRDGGGVVWWRPTDRREEMQEEEEEEEVSPFKRWREVTGETEVQQTAGEVEAEQIEEEQEAGDEDMKPKIRKAPRGPSLAERERHEATHMPYRSWCKFCVKGRGRRTPHLRVGLEDEEREKRVPKIVFDYHFTTDEDRGHNKNPMLGMKDMETGCRYMRAVGQKGIGSGNDMDWLIYDIHEELRSWGYAGGPEEKLIFQSDGEESLLAVLKKVAAFHGGQMIPEVSPPGESQANGAAEENGKNILGMVMTLMEHVCAKVGEVISGACPFAQWVVRWAAMLITRFSVGTDGKTAYERMTGRKCKLEVVPIGETVLYKAAKTAGDRKRMVGESWREGIWLGHNRGSSDTLIGTPEGVVHAWSVKRMESKDRWSKQRIEDMKGVPGQPNPNKPGIRIPVKITMPEKVEPTIIREEIQGRKVYLKTGDFEKYGYTEGCIGCRAKQAGTAARGHSEVCRTRMEKMLSESVHEEESMRWRRAEEKRKPAQEEREAADTSKQANEVEAAEEEAREAEEVRVEERPQAEEVVQEDGPAMEIEVPGTPTWEKPVRRRVDEWEQRSPKRHKEGEEDEDVLMMAESKITRVDVMEIYSEPRVTVEARKFGLAVGPAIDIKTGWDLTKAGERKRCMTWIRRSKPRVVILSPPCGSFSKLQNMNPWSAKRERDLWRGVVMLKFAMEVAKEQMAENRYFVFEHPDSATSWRRKEVEAIGRAVGVRQVVADQCMYGQTVRDRQGHKTPAKKRTRFMTNLEDAERELSRKCDKNHKHEALVGGKAKATEKYPEALCKAMCRMVAAVKRMEEEGVVEVMNTDKAEEDRRELKFLARLDRHVETDGKEVLQGWDDVNAVPLPGEAVRGARGKEVEYIVGRKVFKLMKRKDAIARGIKIVDGRWLDTNKGDAENPNLRSRYVGREFNNNKMEGFFAGTPPLEALRYLVHRAATIRGGRKNKSMMIVDVSRAFFEADARRILCCELPDGYPGNEEGDMVGLLLKSLYGTRDAAHNWVEEVAKFMIQNGFKRGRYNPCLYVNASMDIQVMVHGDDFASVSSRQGLDWFLKLLEERFEVKTARVGPDDDELKEARVLNRIVRYTAEGWEYEPDQRHAELIVEEMQMGSAKSVETPGEKMKEWEREAKAEKLESEKATKYRQVAARANYMAQDRPDVMFAVKEICRGMSQPTSGDWDKLKRLARYILAHIRYVVKYAWQGEEEMLRVYTDSDWGGCADTGRSTSGGTVMVGEHWLKSWSKTQHCITLSSAEAELVAMSKAAAEMLGCASMAKDLGQNLKGQVLADSSSALAVVARRGVGKLRHINITHLWLQELEKRREDPVKFSKVDGSDNPADMLTKYLAKDLIWTLPEGGKSKGWAEVARRRKLCRNQSLISLRIDREALTERGLCTNCVGSGVQMTTACSQGGV